MPAPRHVPLTALRAFEAAARHLSFQRAAQELFVTPAAISQQVRKLERYLETPLFVRGHRAVALTSTGVTLAEALAATFSGLHLALEQARRPAAGALRVSTIESFAAKWLAPRLFRFHRRNPGIRLRIETRDERVDLARDDVDVAIRYGTGRYSGVDAERLMSAPAFPVCSPALLAGQRTPLALRDLARFTLLHDETAQGRRNVPDWAAWLAANGAAGIDAGAGPVFASLHLAQEAAIAGHGICLSLAPLAELDLQAGRLTRPCAGSVRNAYAFWLLRRRGDNRRAVHAFCRWLKEEAAPHDP